ncbi:helix-turn-helix domain-containing protein [Sinomicrobium oceani]|uniref:helix-turn-helix domain-containing protein n=1 Tax=Sinomicrobium oceani TaxID=1150368 RepID=UPI00227AEA51|nr:helix-turn-helix transcriptional regulator [Sinomicrobium oceani]
MDTEKVQKEGVIMGEQVAIARIFRGMKQEALAQLIGVSQATMSTIEHQQFIDDDLLNKIADALNLTPTFIKNISQDQMFQTINNSYIENNTNTFTENTIQAGATVAGHLGQQINPIEKIAELYERLLEVQKEKSEIIESILKSKR